MLSVRGLVQQFNLLLAEETDDYIVKLVVMVFFQPVLSLGFTQFKAYQLGTQAVVQFEAPGVGWGQGLTQFGILKSAAHLLRYMGYLIIR